MKSLKEQLVKESNNSINIIVPMTGVQEIIDFFNDKNFRKDRDGFKLEYDEGILSLREGNLIKHIECKEA